MKKQIILKVYNNGDLEFILKSNEAKNKNPLLTITKKIVDNGLIVEKLKKLFN